MNDYSKLWGGGYDVYAFERDHDMSEMTILSVLMDKFNIRSMVDFGCAIGRWCKVGKDLGMEEVLGIDGAYINPKALVIDEQEFRGEDLATPIELSHRYDLAISLEVAEHLPEDKSDIFVKNLINAADTILFSAAVPGQGGDFHVNEQPMSYWVEKFDKYGYQLKDCIRPVIWSNENVLPMYRQNCIVFIKNSIMDTVPNMGIIDMIHPTIFYTISQKGVMLFPFHRVKKSSEVVLYGAGTVGNMYYRQLVDTNYCKNIIWIDAVRRQACVRNMAVQVRGLETLAESAADYYVIAMEDSEAAKKVSRDLNRKYNIDKKKIIYEKISITRY